MKKIRVAILSVTLLAFVGILYGMSYLSRDYIREIEDASTFYNITDGYIYFGRPNCPSCELFLPLLTSVANQETVNVYYFNTNYFRDNALITEDEMAQILETYQVVEVPIIVEIQNGQVIGSYGANFNENETEMIRTGIRGFLTYGQADVYIPHYSILILLAVVSILVFAINIFLQRKHNFNFILSMGTINLFALVALSISVYFTLTYIENQDLSMNTTMLWIVIFTGVVNVVSLMISIRNYIAHKHLAQNFFKGGDAMDEFSAECNRGN